MKTTDYVSYDLALKLKTCGFDEPCDYVYCKWFLQDTDVELLPKEERDGHYICADAPFLWQAQKWLREKGIDICVLRSFSVKHGYHHRIVKDKDWENEIMQPVCAGRSYEQSLSDAIAAALELIKKGE